MDLIINSAIIMIALYFTIKLAVKNGIKAAYKAITGNDTLEETLNNVKKDQIYNLKYKFRKDDKNENHIKRRLCKRVQRSKKCL